LQVKQDAVKSVKALGDICASAVEGTIQTGLLPFQESAMALGTVCEKLQNRWDESTTEILNIVMQKRTRVIDALKELRSGLNELGCSGVSGESALQENIDQGEPRYLKQMRSIYGESSFYKDFASFWEFDSDGIGIERPHISLKLFQMLQAAVEAYTRQKQLEEISFQQLLKEHTDIVEQQQRLTSYLTHVLQIQKCEGVHEAEAQRILQEWKEKVQSFEVMREKWDPQAQQARKALDETKETLVSLHSSIAASLLQQGGSEELRGKSSFLQMRRLARSAVRGLRGSPKKRSRPQDKGAISNSTAVPQAPSA